LNITKSEKVGLKYYLVGQIGLVPNSQQQKARQLLVGIAFEQLSQEV